jgi:hypothetical protein
MAQDSRNTGTAGLEWKLLALHIGSNRVEPEGKEPMYYEGNLRRQHPNWHQFRS